MPPRLFFPVSPEAQRHYWPTEILDRLRDWADVSKPAAGQDAWPACPSDSQAIVVGWGAPRLPAQVWQGLPDLRIIGIYGGSASYVDSPGKALRDGITLTNASPEMGEGVAETTLALILAAQYDIPESARAFRATGDLSYKPGQTNRSLAGATIGLIGFGHIGSRVAGLMRAFQTKCLVYDPYVKVSRVTSAGCKAASLEDLLSRSDIVSLHAGWTPETEGLLCASRLDLMKPGALVVSTARMPIFDQQALAARVLSGRMRFASDFIPFDPSVWSIDEMKACPHLIAVHGHTSVTRRTLRRMAERVVCDLELFFSGKAPENPVTEDWISRTT